MLYIICCILYNIIYNILCTALYTKHYIQHIIYNILYTTCYNIQILRYIPEEVVSPQFSCTSHERAPTHRTCEIYAPCVRSRTNSDPVRRRPSRCATIWRR